MTRSSMVMITPPWVAPQLFRSSGRLDRKSTRLNSSHSQISYPVFCLKKKATGRPADLHPGIIPCEGRAHRADSAPAALVIPGDTGQPGPHAGAAPRRSRSSARPTSIGAGCDLVTSEVHVCAPTAPPTAVRRGGNRPGPRSPTRVVLGGVARPAVEKGGKLGNGHLFFFFNVRPPPDLPPVSLQAPFRS